MAKDINSIFFDITPEIEELALKCERTLYQIRGKKRTSRSER